MKLEVRSREVRIRSHEVKRLNELPGLPYSAEKTKVMKNSANGIQKEIKVKGRNLGTVSTFKSL